MSKFQYAAVVIVGLRNSNYRGEHWALYHGDINPGSQKIKMQFDSKKISNLASEVQALKDELNDKRGDLTPIQTKGYDKKIMNRRIALQEEIKRHIEQTPSEIPFCHVLAKSALKLVNKAGELGWETTGQIPGYPGPTGITMMRRRIE